MQKITDINLVTLRIRDKALEEKFVQEELKAVKHRWETCTIIFIVMFIFTLMVQWNDKDKLKEFLFNITDAFLVFCLMCLLGRFWLKVHHASLVVLILVRVGWLAAQMHMVINEVEQVQDMFNYYDWSTFALLRVIVPASLLFLTQFNLYLFVVLPLTLITQFGMISYVEKVFPSQQAEEGNETA